MHYAHSTKSTDRSDWQILVCHLRAVARLASARGEKFGAAKAAALAGWLHDLGKYAENFQAYIKSESHDGGDHSTAGAQTVSQLVFGPRDRLIADLLAYAIAGHHAGLPDRTAETGSLVLLSHDFCGFAWL
jgi:CRISPR-associated endonuclease/helicase Cas3